MRTKLVTTRPASIADKKNGRGRRTCVMVSIYALTTERFIFIPNKILYRLIKRKVIDL